jgi:P-type conjugative transfer protein TrbJ
MPYRQAKRKRLAFFSATILGFVSVSPANAGTATGAATEWTQILNNGELVSLVGQSGEQIQNQLNIYKNMLQNTAQLPSHVWGEIEDDLNKLTSVVKQAQGISFSMSNADDILKQRFKSYADLKTNLPSGDSFSNTYQSWSDTNRDTIAGTLSAAGLTADQFDSEENTMEQLRSMSESADGQMKALQVGHEIAAQQVAQMQKLRGLVSQQMTLMGTWLQTKQTDRDLAQARREQFFKSTAPPTSGGKKMQIEW